MDERIPGDAEFLRDYDQFPGSTRRRAAWVRELILSGWRAQNGVSGPVVLPAGGVAVPFGAASLPIRESPGRPLAVAPEDDAPAGQGMALVCELLGEPAPEGARAAAE